MKLRAILKESPLSIYCAALVISSSLYARQLYGEILKVVPREYVVRFVAIILFVPLLLFVLRLNFRRNGVQILASMIVIALVFMYLELPEEKIHIILYGALGWIRVRETKNPRSLYAVITFVFCVSVISESIQAALPNRVCDIRDIIIDTICGGIGAIWAKKLSSERAG